MTYKRSGTKPKHEPTRWKEWRKVLLKIQTYQFISQAWFITYSRFITFHKSKSITEEEYKQYGDVSGLKLFQARDMQPYIKCLYNFA